MKSHVWYVLCAILMLVASPAVLAETYSVPDGGGDHYGDATGDGWGSSCSASASASGSTPSSGGVGWGSVEVYTDTPGWFYCTSSVSAYGYASYGDEDGSGASGSGGGSASAPCGSAFASMSLSSPPAGTYYDEDRYAPWYGWVYAHLDAFEGYSASSSCGAYASVAEDSLDFASGEGSANANVDM